MACGSRWVPSFFAHEGDVVARVAIGPPLLAHEGARSLLRDVPGDDLYSPNPEQVVAMVHLLVGEQVRWFDRIDELLALGAPDWRVGPLTHFAADVVARTSSELPAPVAAAARELVAGLSDRFDAITSCGLPVVRFQALRPEGLLRASVGLVVLTLDLAGDATSPRYGDPILSRPRPDRLRVSPGTGGMRRRPRGPSAASARSATVGDRTTSIPVPVERP